jgi:hypothetical protein
MRRISLSLRETAVIIKRANSLPTDSRSLGNTSYFDRCACELRAEKSRMMLLGCFPEVFIFVLDPILPYRSLS